MESVSASVAGDSQEQREAESTLIELLSKKLKVSLNKKRFKLEGHGWLEIDGFCPKPLILCEAWAHIGWARPAQEYKVMKDALKLLFAAKLTAGESDRILLFADREATGSFQNSGWMAQCLKAYGIKIMVIDLPEDIRSKVKSAQRRQFR